MQDNLNTLKNCFRYFPLRYITVPMAIKVKISINSWILGILNHDDPMREKEHILEKVLDYART